MVKKEYKLPFIKAIYVHKKLFIPENKPPCCAYYVYSVDGINYVNYRTYQDWRKTFVSEGTGEFLQNYSD